VFPAVNAVSLAATCRVKKIAAAMLTAIAVCFGVFCCPDAEAQKVDTCSSRPS